MQFTSETQTSKFPKSISRNFGTEAPIDRKFSTPDIDSTRKNVGEEPRKNVADRKAPRLIRDGDVRTEAAKNLPSESNDEIFVRERVGAIG
ncbi:hypothetical protein Nepgr_010835 [Nepenthes gracilis]|uniref:Uncharacterized protein n=1 Tax=Nepenthes gracilis TaxID=150966 RepID=A0AAD3SE01_NEPGR|nr:hypothetical protein Nepgr_010835 [Nepenthes gracilis]